MTNINSHRFWYTPQSWFHWINTLCVEWYLLKAITEEL